jgi:hypothetical protein
MAIAQRQTETDRDNEGQRQTETGRDGQRQTEIERERKRQTEKKRDIQRKTEKDRERIVEIVDPVIQPAPSAATSMFGMFVMTLRMKMQRKDMMSCLMPSTVNHAALESRWA